MGKYVQGKDGKFAGSIGDGKTHVPSASDVPVNPYKLPSDVDDYGLSLNHVYEMMRNAWCKDILADPTAAIQKELDDYEEARLTGSPRWVIEDMTDPENYCYLIIARKKTASGNVSIAWDNKVISEVSFDNDEGHVEINTDPDGLPHDTRYHSAVKFVAVPYDLYGGSYRGEYQTSYRHYRHGKLHNAFGPAWEDTDGSQIWMEDGKRLASVDADGRIFDGGGVEVTGFLLKRRFKKRFKGMRDAIKYAPSKQI